MASARYAGKSAYHGEVATRYDEDRVGEPLWAREQEFVGEWAATLPKATVVLDVPAGTGRFLPILFQHGLRVHAFDISPDMVAELHRRHPEAAGFDVRVADAERLPLPDGAVAAVLCWRFFHLLPLPVLQRVLNEFRRLCHGPIIVQVLSVRLEDGPRPWLSAVKAVFRPWFGWLHPRRGDKPWSHITSYNHTEKSLLGAFQSAGLVVKGTMDLGENHGLPVRVYRLEVGVKTAG
ncbi:MAG TPA: class I SAM-dependent methyltransferase [Opitutaceae bacterium]|jgi:ubiquinone/menaquinone biosynthesis C-methylase UbiE|nr:class I SAM-dependent methyltransferase [Opitutaceae bacterium]